MSSMSESEMSFLTHLLYLVEADAEIVFYSSKTIKINIKAAHQL